MNNILEPWHLIIIAGIAILVFGGKKLPELGKGLGEGLRGFKDGMKGLSEEDAAAQRKREQLEAQAYQDAKIAAEAKAAAEARLAAEQKAVREGEVVIK
jgi:sec-independent protein translocase protein TatA